MIDRNYYVEEAKTEQILFQGTEKECFDWTEKFCKENPDVILIIRKGKGK